MKRLLSLLLTVALLLSLMPAVFAEVNTDKMEAVLTSVKARIGDTSGYPEFSSDYYNYEHASEAYYNFEWSNDDGNMYVTCTEDGIITDYSKYTYSVYSGGRKKAVRSKRADFESVAADFLKQLNPDIADKYILDKNTEADSLWATDYTYRFTRHENGVPTPDTAVIRVNTDTAEATSLSLSYTKADFEYSDSYISADEAKKAYAGSVGITLQYDRTYSDGESTIALVYVNDDTAVNAVTGEIYEIVYDEYGFKNMMESTADQSAAISRGLSEAEQAELIEISGLISQDEAVKVVTSNGYLDLPEEYEQTVDLLSYSSEYTYSVRFSTEERSAYASVDAKTGELKSFSYHMVMPLEKAAAGQKYTDAQLGAVHAEAIKALMPNKYSEYVHLPGEDSSDDGTVSVSYRRYVNGVPVSFDGMNLVINKENGKVCSFNYGYTDEPFPSPENVIAPNAAMKIMFQSTDFSLKYVYEEADGAVSGKLIYSFGNSNMQLDAFSGEPVNNYSEGYTAPVYNDIEGHYAKESIAALADYGITISGDEAFRPDEAITQRDFLRLAIELAYDYDLYIETDEEIYNYAKRCNIISEEEINPEAAVTRLEAAKLLVRAMDAERYAAIDGIYISPYADVTEGVGYVSLLYGIGVVKGNGYNAFYPYNNLTRADAMVMIYNYFLKIG